MQEQLDKVAKAFESGGGLHLNALATEELRELYDSVADKGEVVKQVAIFAARPGEQKPLTAVAIMELLAPPPKIAIPVLAPHLDAENPKLRSFVRDWFQAHDNGGADETPLTPVNFEDYLDYLRQHQDPPAAFVDYIYERSPGRALIVFYRASRRADAIMALKVQARRFEAARQEAGLPPLPVKAKEFDERLVAEQIVRHAIAMKKWENGKLLPEAKEQLAKIAGYKEWWVRRYVAEIMRRHPELRVPDIMEKLRKDSNPSVSKAAKSISE